MNKLILVAALAACHHETPPPATAATNAPLTVDAQVAQGKQLYVDHCAKCHGDAGQGSKQAPPVVGKDAFPLDPRPGQKRDTKFHTAADVFAFATKAMPPRKVGSLTTDQYLAIFAFDLTANGIKLDHPLDAAAAQAIVLHP
ncbi:MAG: c-type cytochrome [Acidobacteriota bacterium]